MSDLPKEAIHFVEAVTAHFGAPEAVIFHNKQKAVSMTKKFDDTNRGVLFRDDKKAKAEDRDYSGSINVGGTEYWLSGWVKESKKGAKFLSLSIKLKAPAEAKPELDDAIPF